MLYVVSQSVNTKLFMTPHKNIVEALNCLALPYPMYTWGQISLMLLRSYGVLRKIKILDFDKNVLQEFRKTWGSFKGFYANF